MHSLISNECVSPINIGSIRQKSVGRKCFMCFFREKKNWSITTYKAIIFYYTTYGIKHRKDNIDAIFKKSLFEVK